MKKILMVSCLVHAALFASTAHAGQVDWSVGINAPGVGAVVSNGPVYVQPPVIYAPPPRVVHQNPVVVYVEGPKKHKKHKKHKKYKGHDHAHRDHELRW